MLMLAVYVYEREQQQKHVYIKYYYLCDLHLFSEFPATLHLFTHEQKKNANKNHPPPDFAHIFVVRGPVVMVHPVYFGKCAFDVHVELLSVSVFRTETD